MKYLLFLPFVIHALCMLFDEFYFHHKRSLGKWERLGHPIDTLSVLICFAIPLFNGALSYYVAMSIFSSILITKDEWVHQKECEAQEQWLHSVLFVLHPILLALYGAAFYSPSQHLSLIHSQAPFLLLTTFLFGLYQFFYWNFLCKKKLLT